MGWQREYWQVKLGKLIRVHVHSRKNLFVYSPDSSTRLRNINQLVQDTLEFYATGDSQIGDDEAASSSEPSHYADLLSDADEDESVASVEETKLASRDFWPVGPST
eukprot:5389632-Amphidinium_carterae.1